MDGLGHWTFTLHRQTPLQKNLGGTCSAGGWNRNGQPVHKMLIGSAMSCDAVCVYAGVKGKSTYMVHQLRSRQQHQHGVIYLGAAALATTHH